MSKVKFDYDLIVIGSGPAGSVAAELSARSGKRVAVIEQGELGGSAPRTGDVPMQALLSAAHHFDDARRSDSFGLRTNMIGYNYPSIKNWKDLAVKRSGVDATADYFRSREISVFHGRAHLLSDHEVSIARRHLSFDKMLIATGVKPTIPKIPGLDSIDYLTAETAIDLIRPPKSLLIIGAGFTGVQFAELFSVFGTKVHLLDTKKRIISSEDDEVSDALTDALKRLRDVDVLTTSRVVSVKNEGSAIRADYVSGEIEQSIKVEKILVTTGWSANIDIGLGNAGVDYDEEGILVNEQLATSADNIYAAGAVIDDSNSTHSALYESKIVARNLWSKSTYATNRSLLPRVLWTTPEIAAVGFTESDLVREDIKFTSTIVQNSTIARANVANFGLGFAKILTDSKGLIFGASIVAPNAAESISQISLAIKSGLNATDVADTSTAFGSWSEAIRLACAKVK